MSDQKEILEQFDPLTNKDFSDNDTDKSTTESINDPSDKRNKGPNELEKKCDSQSDDSSPKGTETDEVERAITTEEEQQTNGHDDEPFFDFQLFIKQLQDSRSVPLVKYIKSFLEKFVTQRQLWTTEEQQKLINDFKLFIYGKFDEYEPFKSLDEVKLHNAKEGIEKLVMGKLYTHCFAPFTKKRLRNTVLLDKGHKQDLIADKKLREKIEEFRFIEPDNLDIIIVKPNKLKTFVNYSGIELDKVNNFKAPRDKMVCILNSCKVIFGYLKHYEPGSDDGDAKGADSFIPLLIYTILKSKVQFLVSNVKYIERFRLEEFLRGEESYYLSSIQAAIDFIMTLDVRSLTINDYNVYNERYHQNKIKLEKEKEVIKEKRLQKESSTTSLSSKATDISRHPFDEITNSMFSVFNDLFISSGDEESSKAEVEKATPTHNTITTTATQQVHMTEAQEEDIGVIVEQMEENERNETMLTLQNMFPDMDKDLIEDVCRAKKYRIGPAVDALLMLSD
ncbi:guanine nucleotide exchange factor VPS9 NDAI_0K00170 [Naumovozyma dairenensis CBS 421]|uniref:VPS9 domain-containing protein n=1 Tax=Naumovozyma dairenensis (strain ATCC 10597 / BCRC 20456 / CBS 421 / NBRC 0211 / NRRL Y-12639) TaxID=1071378 RepID=G0WHE5_NAUDC|nr:hypothetical protein NDAI_0K00170 [Naumovozyma dairenensis CBS 421]CCD27206.1 hypothetical protein NDAI_0K00170 [Naumovozyma dairenensis CBS 421]